jgi:ribosomal protein S18 acetylase RimI-like enzyme
MRTSGKVASACVRPALASDVRGMSQSLARAFHDDPVWSWFMPADATRAQRLERMFATLTRKVYLRYGNDCYTTDGYEGASLWVPPGPAKLSVWDVVRILPGWIRAIGWRDLLRAQRGIDSFEKLHPPEPHYYLAFVGVSPEFQGCGLGTALVRPVLEKCDREQTPAYLEATSVGSRTCYERLGFLTRAEEHLPAQGPAFWTMWRPPAC